MSARLIDGKALSAGLRDRVAAAVDTLAARHAFTPGLAVVLVGDDAASEVYVRNKGRQTIAAGLRPFEHRLPASATQAALIELIGRLNADDAVDGILVQLPLPAGIDERRIVEAVDPAKDVDGFHPLNAGRLMTGSLREGTCGLVPCTPLGCLMLIRSVRPDLTGLEAVVVGRSNIVGKPMAQLLLGENCTVTIAHSKTRNLVATCRRADILVAAVGRPGLIRGTWIKPGATVVDVGINRVPAPDLGAGRTRLIGDVAHDEAVLVAGAVTPVPGGVGPMTIACLLRNTVEAACRRRGLAVPAF